jgi:hypothetical protein
MPSIHRSVETPLDCCTPFAWNPEFPHDSILAPQVVLLAPRGAHHARPLRHRAVLLTPCAAHLAGHRHYRIVHLVLCGAHLSNPYRHCAHELRVSMVNL